MEPCADVRRGAARERRRGARLSRCRTTRDGAAGTVIQLAQHASLPRRIKVVSGIRRDEAEALLRGQSRPSDRAVVRRVVRASFGILSRGEVSEWLMVPLSKSGVRKHRGFESRPLRQHSIDAGPVGHLRPVLTCPGRGRLVDYGAALEMRFGATRRGFESRPLRHPRRDRSGRCPRWRLRSSLTHLSGALVPVLGRRLGLDRPAAARGFAGVATDTHPREPPRPRTAVRVTRSSYRFDR